MFDFLWLINTVSADNATNIINHSSSLTINGIISIIWLFALFIILVTEKIDKTIISVLIAGALIFLQVFVWVEWNLDSSQEIAWKFIYHNLDIFAFIIGMMIISGIAKDSWVFNFISLSIAKKIKGSPVKLFFILSYISFFLTVFISNIPTIIILAPIVVLITKKLDVPTTPYIIWIITFANLGWAVTPISDPTTYYQATTLWLSFSQVISNTWLIMFSVTISSSIYLYLVFKKDFNHNPDLEELSKVDPSKYIEDKKEMIISLLILFIVILLVIFKDMIFSATGIKFDNGTIALFWAFFTILLLKLNVSNILNSKVDYSTLFFFAGLFIIVWSLEHNWIIVMLADKLVEITSWDNNLLLLMFTMWSSILSVFVDNVPYNIAMVSTLEAFRDNQIVTWTAWTALAWGLNSCTSIGWAWSPIWAACNVIALGQAEKTWIILKFAKYLMIGIPLVLINSFIAYLILYFRYLG